MSMIMKPPHSEYNVPPIADYAVPSSNRKPPRTSYGWVWIVLGIFVLLTILGAVLFALGLGYAVTTYGGPTIVSDQYYTALRSQDYAKAYSLLGSHLKTVYSQQEFTQAAMQRDAADGRVSHYSYGNVPVGEPATVTLTVTRTNGSTYTVHLEMRQEGGVWKVSAFDRI